jgi:hypothetical protein
LADEQTGDAKIVDQVFAVDPDGVYGFNFETSNGIMTGEKGRGGDDKAGSIQYTDNENNSYHLTYTANENGYQPVGDHIPRTPDSVLRTLYIIRDKAPEGVSLDALNLEIKRLEALQ